MRHFYDDDDDGYISPTSSKEGLAALCATLIVFTTTFTFLRFYTRRLQKLSLGADDWTVLPSYFAFLGMAVVGLVGIALHEYGYNEEEVEAFGLPFAVEAALTLAIDMLSTLALGFARITALLFYRRLFCGPGRSPKFLAAIYVMIGLISLWTITFVILPPLQCGPHLDLWHWTNAERKMHCTLGIKIVPGCVVTDLIFEVLVLALPIPNIVSLKLPVRRRLAILLVFLTASVSLGGVITRLVTVVQFLSHGIQDLPLANSTQTFFWTLEAGFSLIAVNLPSLWWLRKVVMGHGSRSGTKSRSSSPLNGGSNNKGHSRNLSKASSSSSSNSSNSISRSFVSFGKFKKSKKVAPPSITVTRSASSSVLSRCGSTSHLSMVDNTVETRVETTNKPIPCSSPFLPRFSWQSKDSRSPRGSFSQMGQALASRLSLDRGERNLSPLSPPPPLSERRIKVDYEIRQSVDIV